MKVLRGIFEESKFSEKMKKYYEKEGAEVLHTMCGKLPVVMIYGKIKERIGELERQKCGISFSEIANKSWWENGM